MKEKKERLDPMNDLFQYMNDNNIGGDKIDKFVASHHKDKQ